MSQLPLFHTVRHTSWAARSAPRATAASVLQQAVALLPEICLRRQVLNSRLNYLLQFPAPTGAYVQVNPPTPGSRQPASGHKQLRRRALLSPCHSEAPHARAPAGGVPGVLLLPRAGALLSRPPCALHCGDARLPGGARHPAPPASISRHGLEVPCWSLLCVCACCAALSGTKPCTKPDVWPRGKPLMVCSPRGTACCGCAGRCRAELGALQRRRVMSTERQRCAGGLRVRGSQRVAGSADASALCRRASAAHGGSGSRRGQLRRALVAHDPRKGVGGCLGLADAMSCVHIVPLVLPCAGVSGHSLMLSISKGYLALMLSEHG